jgi:hypothetical protein
MIYELRRYELQQNNKAAFYERFEVQLMPLFEKYGFKLEGAWDTAIGDVPEYTYVLAWTDLNTRQAAWAKLNEDVDWTRIKKESQEKHGALVLKTHSQILQPTNYSPLK